MRLIPSIYRLPLNALCSSSVSSLLLPPPVPLAALDDGSTSIADRYYLYDYDGADFGQRPPGELAQRRRLALLLHTLVAYPTLLHPRS